MFVVVRLSSTYVYMLKKQPQLQQYCKSIRPAETAFACTSKWQILHLVWNLHVKDVVCRSSSMLKGSCKLEPILIPGKGRKWM
jgi:hypothetical protein